MVTVATGGLEHFIEVLVAVVEVGHIGHFPAVHHSADGIRTLSAGLVVIQEADSFAVGADIGAGFFQVGDGVEHHNVAAGLFAGLHHLPGEEVEEAFKYGDMGGFGLDGEFPVRADGSDAGLGSALEGA